MVDRFECVLAAVLHEDPPVVPQTIGFTNEMARSKFMPFIEDGVSGISGEAGKGAREKAAGLERRLGEAEFLDSFLVGVGGGGFKVERMVKAGPGWCLAEWETGAVWRMGTAENVWAREYVEYPVGCEEDLGDLELPDPDDPERYEGLESAVRCVRDKGFFPLCSINGFFSGVWYFLRGPLHVILRDLYSRRRFFEQLIAKVGEFNLRAERNLLERGATMIGWVDDLGYNMGPFMSLNLYEELIFPWHEKAIDLAHKYGAFVNMHSHGNINAIVPLLVRAGLDVLNPVGPSDNMDLRAVKDRYGDHLCFQGGLSKHLGFMNREELKSHVRDRLRLGSPGGGFILGSEGGIPYEMEPDRFSAFIEMSRRYRRNTRFS